MSVDMPPRTDLDEPAGYKLQIERMPLMTRVFVLQDHFKMLHLCSQGMEIIPRIR
jgi:hypothetical protein